MILQGINAPVYPFDTPALVHAAARGDREWVEQLLEAGADINRKSSWWAARFGVLDNDRHEQAEWLVSKGAIVNAYAAARHGWLDRLREFPDGAINMRGGDGQTPLHVARNVETAEYLLSRGAEIDTLDIDHESTPAQYALGDRQDVTRLLVARGCRTDILMGAALNDLLLVRKHLDQVRMRVTGEYLPMKNRDAGGHIYLWTIGLDHSAHQIAWKHGNNEVLELLMEHSPSEVRQQAVADRVIFAAQDNNTYVVRMLLAEGLPVDGGSRRSPLHWAAWHGNREMVELLIQYKAPLEKQCPDYGGTPMDHAKHGAQYGWHCKTGDYAGVQEALRNAGAV